MSGVWGKNKGNKEGIGNRKTNIGYAFEVHFTVEGKPSLCKEIQLVKSTQTGPGAKDKTWTGKTADLDLDGKPDIDVPTKDKCEAATPKGTWDDTAKACTLKFPQGGTKYGPDAENDAAAGGAYQKEFDYKKYLKKEIIWFDAPFIPRANDSTRISDFVAIVRGTDDKFCYVKFTVKLHSRKQGEASDIEELTAEAPVTGAANVPGVP